MGVTAEVEREYITNIADLAESVGERENDTFTSLPSLGKVALDKENFIRSIMGPANHIIPQELID